VALLKERTTLPDAVTHRSETGSGLTGGSCEIGSFWPLSQRVNQL
jgi:hypothetical protein